MEEAVQVLGQGMDGKLQYCPSQFCREPRTALKISLKKKKTFQWAVLLSKSFPGGVRTDLPMRETQETQVTSLGREDPLEEGWQPTPVFLTEESHGQRSLVGYSP